MTGEMQSPDALISVIVPVYKAEQTLDRCVGSIVSQTYRNLEIILVDDGSPDDCPAMCDTWSVKDARIKVVHQKNGGVTKARNTGLACATGDLLAWVDSDDWIDQHY
ncbi:glycosyltransferase, partial [Lactobacillus rhamnosus]|nr:glycosyltransferase [Lacticaseibacillus rhamnosus]